MKKLLLLIPFIGIQTFSQISETTSDFGMWEINYMLDEFGEPTAEGYITQKININGEFSRFLNYKDIVTNFRVEFIIREREVSLQLYEDGNNHPLRGYDNYRVQIKHNGKIVTLGLAPVDHFKAYNTPFSLVKFNKSGSRLKIFESQELINLFFQGGEFKFNITEMTDHRQRKYLFQIDDAAGFLNAYKILID